MLKKKKKKKTQFITGTNIKNQINKMKDDGKTFFPHEMA